MVACEFKEGFKMLEPTNRVRLENFVSVEDLSAAEVNALIDRAEYFKRGGAVPKLTRPVYVVNGFFENSTRTHTSFCMAERKLGLTEIPFDPTHSSVKKGETLYDTMLTMTALGVDLAVIRHSENNYYDQLIHPKPNEQLNIGVVNGGDGSGQHPSQCLLDVMTIHEHFKTFQALKVAIIGDISHSRVARSNAQLLTKLGAKVYFSGPKCWFNEDFTQYGEYKPVDELVGEMDAIMLLRVQHERLAADDAYGQDFSTTDYHEQFGLNKSRYDQMKDNAIIMHPGPINRDVELASELVEAPKSVFFRQMQNGVFMRMAMIEAVLRGRKLGGLE